MYYFLSILMGRLFLCLLDFKYLVVIEGERFFFWSQMEVENEGKAVGIKINVWV